jgi:hypothetical protein
MCEHEHLKAVRNFVMDMVIKPINPEAPSMTPAVTTQEIKDSKILREARAIIEARADADRPFTPDEYKIVAKAAKVRQQAEALRKETV